jgi:hypothetical protein
MATPLGLRLRDEPLLHFSGKVRFDRSHPGTGRW